MTARERGDNKTLASSSTAHGYVAQNFDQGYTQYQEPGNDVAQQQHMVATPATPPGYIVQNLEERYIRSRVLDNYVRGRMAEFGSQYQRTTLHDHHRIVIKRPLRQDEILYLQRTSFPAYPAQYFSD